MTFDPHKEEHQGAWMVLGLYSTAAIAVPAAGLWMARELESGSGPHSGMGAPLALMGLAIVGIASLVLGLAGVIIVIYAVVRIRVHGPLFLIGSVLATCLAATPVVMGWNEIKPGSEGAQTDVPAVASKSTAGKPGAHSASSSSSTSEHAARRARLLSLR